MQATINKEIVFTGTGLHSGKTITMTACPAGHGSGIFFVRSDLPGAPHLHVNADSVCRTTLATTIGLAGVEVATVEHLLAAVYAAGISNLAVRLNGPEVPALDGSALLFYRQLKEAVTLQGAARPKLYLERPVKYGDENTGIEFHPSDHLSVDCLIDFPGSVIGRQRYESSLVTEEDWLGILTARTFGFKQDIDNLKAMGVALGGSLDNAILIDGSSVINREGLRFADEFVRHKAMDLVGDLSLCQYELCVHVVARRSGHRINNEALLSLMADPARTIRLDRD